MFKFTGYKRAGCSIAPMPCAPLALLLLLAGLNQAASGQNYPSTGSQQYFIDLASYQQELAAGASRDAVLKVRDPAAPSLPAADPPMSIPISGTSALPNVKIESRNGLISLVVRDVALYQVLSLIAQAEGLNVVSSEDITAKVSVTLDDVPIEDALTSILSIAGYTWSMHNNVIHVASTDAAQNLPAAAQGRRVMVFRLDYAAASIVHAAVTGFLSPAGKAFFHTSLSDDNLRTEEFIVVEDIPQFLGPIRDYIAQIDQPPRQVMIEAYILEVELKDDVSHGVNFENIFNVAGNSVTIETTGFANPAATPAFLATLTGGNLDALIEALQTTTDVKTLAKPKILVLNGQTAHMQVGEQLGFRVTTTTETSSLESVDFLNVGVVLTVTPRISRDNRVMLHVKPEVSSGKINPTTELPEEETTEVETDVLLDDGQGMVIGGLIQEKDSTIQTKIPFLGDLWLVGKLFQKSQVIKSRSEIIVVLVPHVVPYVPAYEVGHQVEVDRSTTPLLECGLDRVWRPWEPILPETIRNPLVIRLPHVLPHDKAECDDCLEIVHD